MGMVWQSPANPCDVYKIGLMPLGKCLNAFSIMLGETEGNSKDLSFVKQVYV